MDAVDLDVADMDDGSVLLLLLLERFGDLGGRGGIIEEVRSVLEYDLWPKFPEPL